MELGLSLGDHPPSNSNKPFGFLSKPLSSSSSSSLMALGFCVGLIGHHSTSASASASVHDDEEDEDEDEDDDNDQKTVLPGSTSGLDPPVQLDLLPLAPVPRSSSSSLPFPWLSHHLMAEVESSERGERVELDVNRVAAAAAEETEDKAVAALSSPNSTVSCFQMEFGVRNGGGIRRKRSWEMEMEITERGGCSRMSDDDDNNASAAAAAARKKLRLSKQQSAFLEESFKEHTTLNPKQKLALAKQLNLRPRQVEVWFQNRRARTKLKQTEVDCEYLRRCCETLTEENRRLQKELQELRALKTSQPFYMQLPATTLTMCPSCERVATATATATTTAPTASVAPKTTTPTPSSALCLANKPKILPFPHLHQAAS
ncbi:homeobox-leucine zipper protein HOX11-like [Benincasa hispida]|uniref:homeobox-leucine zipper protein HOX11-like n=1 Tax=Benincasa hispida TaxID=102211 RepID=UPI0019003159|nr:homeobox-leucine zipper protein HOX11-like [Benincasa hispida]